MGADPITPKPCTYNPSHNSEPFPRQVLSALDSRWLSSSQDQALREQTALPGVSPCAANCSAVLVSLQPRSGLPYGTNSRESQLTRLPHVRHPPATRLLAHAERSKFQDPTPGFPGISGSCPLKPFLANLTELLPYSSGTSRPPLPSARAFPSAALDGWKSHQLKRGLLFPACASLPPLAFNSREHYRETISLRGVCPPMPDCTSPSSWGKLMSTVG